MILVIHQIWKSLDQWINAEEASVRRREDEAQDVIEEGEKAILFGWGGVWCHNEDLKEEIW